MSFAEIGWYYTIAPSTVLLVLQRAFRTAFNMLSSHQTRDLECFADSSNTPWNPPTIHCPDRTAIAPQMSLLSLCARLSQQSHLFLNGEVLTYNDSMMNLHKLCHIPRNCQCRRLLVSSLAPRTSSGSSGTPGKILICTGMIVSTVLPSLVIKSPNCSTLGTTVPVRFLQEALVIVFFKQVSQFGSFGKERIYTVLTRTWFHFCSRLPLEIHEMTRKCLDFLALGFPRLCWSTFIDQILSEFQKPIRQVMRYISLYFFAFLIFCFRFLWIHAAGLTEALHSYCNFFLVLDFRCTCWHQIRNLVMKMMEKLVKVWLKKNSLINQEPQMCT